MRKKEKVEEVSIQDTNSKSSSKENRSATQMIKEADWNFLTEESNSDSINENLIRITETDENINPSKEQRDSSIPISFSRIKETQKRKMSQVSSSNTKRNKIIPVPNLKMARNKAGTAAIKNTAIKDATSQSATSQNTQSIKDLLMENKQLREKLHKQAELGERSQGVTATIPTQNRFQMLDDSTQGNFTQEEEMKELERREDEKEIKKDLKKKNDRIQHRYVEKYSQAACKETINNNKEEENNNSYQRRTQKENANRITTKRRDNHRPLTSYTRTQKT